MINKPSPLDTDSNKDPKIKALKRRGLINHGSTLSPLNPTGKVAPAQLGLQHSMSAIRHPTVDNVDP